MYDVAGTSTHAAIGGAIHDRACWRPRWKLEKYDGDWTPEQIDAGLAGLPVETIETEGNLLTTNGVNAMLTALIGGTITAFSNANAYIGVGDSSTAEAASQTDLQASTNKLRKAMDATYPIVTTNSVTFRATFGGTDANFAWAEFGTFNAASAGTMLNRKVSAQGTKASGATWVFSETISVS